MKKIFAILLAGVICVGLIGCSSTTKENTISEIYSIAQQAMSIEEQYMAGKLDASGAEEALDSICDELQEKAGDDNESEAAYLSTFMQGIIESFNIALRSGKDVDTYYSALQKALSD